VSLLCRQKACPEPQPILRASLNSTVPGMVRDRLCQSLTGQRTAGSRKSCSQVHHAGCMGGAPGSNPVFPAGHSGRTEDGETAYQTKRQHRTMLALGFSGQPSRAFREVTKIRLLNQAPADHLPEGNPARVTSLPGGDQNLSARPSARWSPPGREPGAYCDPPAGGLAHWRLLCYHFRSKLEYRSFLARSSTTKQRTL
jgi:hypothetical protein